MVKRDLEIVYNASLDPVEMKPEMEKLIIGLTEIIPLDNQDERKKLAKKIKGDSREKVLQKMAKEFLRFYEEREKRVGKEISREIDKSILLYTIDHLWVDHLTALDSLKEGVRLRGYGQRDPLVEYRKESYQMFQDLLGKIDYHVARRVLRVEVANQPKQEGRISEGRGKLSLPSQGSSGEVSREGNDVFSDNQEERQKVEKVVSNQEKVGRNDPCPCGSGKKYKKCCYPKFG